MVKKLAACILSLAMTTAAFAGCQSTGTASSAVSTGNQTSGDTIKIGAVVPLTGQVSSFGQSAKKGLELLQEQTNSAGGINGRKVEFLIQDDEGKAASAVTVGQKLINSDKVAAIVGPLTSTSANSLAPICQQYGIPMVTGTGTNVNITKAGDYVFRTCFIDPFQGQVMAKFAAEDLKAKTAAVLFNNGDDYSKGLADAFKSSFTAKGGSIVDEETYNTGDKDFNAQLTKISPKKPDVLFLPEYYGDVAVIAKEARNANIKSTFLGGDGWDSSDLFKIGGDAVNNGYFSNHYAADDTAKEVVEFIKAFQAKYSGETPDAMAALNYDAGKVLLECIKKANSTDGAKVRDALKAFDGTVVSGHIKFNESRDAVKAAVIIKTDNGKEKFFKKIQPDS
jgi:branched-chain amino acid transport system substrate-binding protein